MSETLSSLIERAKYAPSLKNDITTYFHIAVLSRSIGEIKTYEKFARKLERAFRDVPETKGSKKIGSFIYKQNGVLENNKEAQCIVLNEWTPSYKPIKRKSKKSNCFTMREFVNFNGYFPGDVLLNKYSSSLNYLNESIANYWTQKREYKKNVEINSPNTHKNILRVSYPTAIKYVLMYRSIKTEQNVDLLNIPVNHKNYKLILFMIARTLMHAFKSSYDSYDSLVYFSKDTTNKIKAEINKKRSVYSIEEVSLSIIEKVLSKEYVVEKIEIPEIPLIMDIIRRMHKKNRLSSSLCDYYQIRLKEGSYILTEEEISDESNDDLFEELWNLLYNCYNSLYEKSANDPFLTWLFTEEMSLIESNPNP